jgi:hypothetical protein
MIVSPSVGIVISPFRQLFTAFPQLAIAVERSPTQGTIRCSYIFG